MVCEANIVHIEPEGELGRLLDRVDGTPLRLEMNGVQHLLSREDAESPAISNEEYQRVLDETLGSLSKEEGERLLAALYRTREEDADPADRP